MGKSDIENKIKLILDRLNVDIALHGGNISFVSFNELTGVVTIRFEGACINCPISFYTLKYGIESALKESIKGITEVNSI